jgi:hypothetical protein
MFSRETSVLLFKAVFYCFRTGNWTKVTVFYTHIHRVIHSFGLFTYIFQQKVNSCLSYFFYRTNKFVRVGRIGLPSHPWQGRVLPLNHTRIKFLRCARQDSNPQPLGPKPSALSIELRAQLLLRRNVSIIQIIRKKSKNAVEFNEQYERLSFKNSCASYEVAETLQKCWF